MLWSVIVRDSPKSKARSKANLKANLKRGAPPRRRTARPRTAPKPYHHGDLRRALIEAGFRLIEEGGVEQLSMREAARRAGVSPGAPFRHFESREALVTAVAIEAQRRFRAEIDAALKETPPGDPLARFRGFGVAYLRWAMRNPAHFEIISSGRLFDYDKSADLVRDNAEVIAMVEQTLKEALALGQLRVADLKQVQITGRALVYGFARMNIDGHFPRWGVAAAEAERTAEAVVDLFIDGIAKRQP
jgi:AcrR family transcriptional regulator